MPASTAPLTEAMPAARTEAARLRSVLGYQVAQASISTLGVFGQEVEQPFGLRPVEYTVLALVAESPGLAPTALARALAVTAPNITSWVDRLAQRRLVRREQSETDKRSQRLYATDAGARLVVGATARLMEGEREAFADLSEGERMLLIELLRKVASARTKPK